MIEALLIIWLGVGTAQTIAAVRYETVEQCEAAKAAVISDGWVNGWLPENRVHCVKVPKTN